MIENVKIYNRFNMDTFAHQEGLTFPYKEKNWSLISIYTEENQDFLTEKNIEIMKGLGMREYLSLRFWDIDNDFDEIKAKYPDAVFFTEEQAEQIIGMIANADQDDNATLVAHCDAGISRSGAVGTFAVDFLGLDYKQFVTHNPYLAPNGFVLSTLRRAAGLTPSFEDLK